MSTHAEAPTQPEILDPAIGIKVEAVEMRADTRPNFAYLDKASQEAYTDSHPDYFNRVKQSKCSVVMATTADEGHDWADSLATDTTSAVVAGHLESHDFDGASEADAIHLMQRAVGDSNAELRFAKNKEGLAPTWAPAEANLSAIRFFRNEKGEQKAVISNTGTNRVLKSTLDGTEVVMDAMVDPFTGGPAHTINGDPSGITSEVKVVDVHPGERFILVDSKLGEQDGSDATAADIGAVGGRNVTDNPAQAVDSIADITEAADDAPGYASRIGDSTTVVVDVETQRDWNRAEKLLRIPTQLVVGAQIRAHQRQVQNREAYLENPTRLRRILAAADIGSVAGVGILGYKLVSAVMGHAHGGGGSNMVQDALHTHASSAAPSPSASHNSNLFDNLTKPSGSASPSADHAPTAPVTAPTHTNEVPSSGTVPTNVEHLDPNHLPAGVHLTDEQVKWLESSHSEGAIGAFHTETGADGLGNHGTVWHNAMESLHDAGYDPSKMSHDEKTAYVQHVLNINHLSWDQAAQEADKFKPVMPTNQDIFSTMSHITAHHEGGPLMPAANSDMAHHLNDIKGTVEAQIGGHTSGSDGTHTGGGHVPAGNGTPASHPTTAPTTHATTHPTTKVTTHPTTHPTAAPSADAAPNNGVPRGVMETNDWIVNHEVPLLAGGAAIAAAAVGAAAVHVIRNRGKGVTVIGGDGFSAEGNSGLPEDLRGKSEPESSFSSDDDDEDDDEEKPVRIFTGKPSVRPSAPGGRYDNIPPAPKA
jgi:hypothetical protein